MPGNVSNPVQSVVKVEEQILDNVANAAMLMHSLNTPDPFEKRTAQEEFVELMSKFMMYGEELIIEYVSKNDMTITELDTLELEVDYPGYLNRILGDNSEP
jgi:hypothetical protein